MPVEYLAQSLVASGTATAPAASAVLASIIGPPPGSYEVEVTLSLTGTAEPLVNNIQLRASPGPNNVLSTLPGTTKYIFRRVNVTNGNISLVVAATSTAGAIYTATITATQLKYDATQ